jgi:hypothetical protein
MLISRIRFHISGAEARDLNTRSSRPDKAASFQMAWWVKSDR